MRRSVGWLIALLAPISIKPDLVGYGDPDAADDKKSNHARTCPQAPLQRSCHEVTEGLLAYAQLTGYAKMTAVINTPIKNRENRYHPFSLHDFYISSADASSVMSLFAKPLSLSK